MNDRRKNPTPQVCYGIYNFGRLIDIAHRRKDAIAIIEEQITGRPWPESKDSMETHKVIVTKLDNNTGKEGRR